MLPMIATISEIMQPRSNSGSAERLHMEGERIFSVVLPAAE